MPRPKRTKVAPSIPADRHAKPNGRLINPKNIVEDISDEEEGRTADAKAFSRSWGRSAHQSKDGPQSVNQITRSINSGDAIALDGMRRRRDAAMDRLDNENNTSTQLAASSIGSSPDVEVGRRAVATPHADNSLLAIGNFRRRTRQPSILGRKDSRARSSSVESNLAESKGLTNIPAEGSILARGTMRRRQRQPSILGRAASRVRSSSVGLEMDGSTPGNSDSAVRKGALKRRSRQPSILRTGRVDDQKGSGYEYDDEDDFNPDDESTPLNLSKTRSTGHQASQSLSSASNPRKRKLSSQSIARSSPTAEDADESSAPQAPAASSPNSAAEQVLRPRTPEPLSDIMAPPRSSSSPRFDSPEVVLPYRVTTTQTRGRALRRQPNRKPLAPPREESLPSSPPSLTHSPNRPESPIRRGRAPTRPSTHPANLSTVQLQALLPRRRRHQARDPFDIESSDDGEIDTRDLGSDDDELTHLTTRTNRTTTRSSAPRSVSRLKPGPSLKSKSAPATECTKVSSATTTTATTRKTYLPASKKNPISDKENESDDGPVDPDDSLAPIPDAAPAPSPEDSQVLEERVGKELKTAKRKFEVVDRWELEFEDFTAGSSSPWDAR